MPDTNNPQRVIELAKASGKLEIDDNGYTRFTPSDDELARIERFLSEEMTRTLGEYETIWQGVAENIRTYKATKMTIEGSGESMLPAPIARIPADQIIARTFNTIMRPRPVVSVDAYFKGDYPVVIPQPQEMPGAAPAPPPMQGGPMPPVGPPQQGQLPGAPPQAVPMVIQKSAEDIARGLEIGLEFKNLERLSFAEVLFKSIHNAVIGAPGYIKVCADQQYRATMAPKINGATIDLTDKSERYVADGEAVHYYFVPNFNFIKPVEEDDLDKAMWCAERQPEDPWQFTLRCGSDEHFLVKEEDVDKLSKMVTDARNPFLSELKEVTQKKQPTAPKQEIDEWQVLFYWDSKYVDPEDGKKKVKRLSLQGDFHLTGRRLLNCYLNPYDHQRRYYVPVDQMEDGDSTVGVLKYHQRVSTHIIQADIKNEFHANNFLYWYDPDSPVASYFESGKHLKPGANIPGKVTEDWGIVPGGAEHQSLLPLANFIVGEAKEASNVSAYKTGQEIPGRTPSSTVSQILEEGNAQPNLFLGRLNRQFAKVFRLYLETARQYQPMGETIPVKDEVTKQVIEVPFRFPVAEVLDNFRISLTAADDAMAKAHDFEQQSMRLHLWQQYATFVAQVAGPAFNPAASPSQVAFFQKVVEGAQKIYDQIIGDDRTDEESFDLSAALNGIIQERELAAQQAAMNPQPPQPPPPKISISLSGKLTPDQEASAAQMEGIGGMNAQNQAAQGGGAVPGPAGQPNSGGLAGAGGQPNVPPSSGPPPAQGVPPPGGLVH